MPGTAVSGQCGDVVVFPAAILAYVFILQATFVGLMPPASIRMMAASIPRQARQVVILAAAIPADIGIAIRPREQLMLSLALGMSRTAIGQQ